MPKDVDHLPTLKCARRISTPTASPQPPQHNPSEMETIKFVNELKHILWNIETFGGNPTIYVTPNHELLKRLREFIFETIKDKDLSLTTDEDWQRSSFFDDILSTDRFEKRIRYCIIKLREFGVPEKDCFAYISQALGIVLDRNARKQKQRRPSNATLQDSLIQEVAKCFEIWYYPSEVQYYDFAIEHQLVYFDHTLRKWRLSSLGQYLLNLPPFEAIVFLCALEVILGRKGPSNRYLNSQVLEKLLEAKPMENTRHLRRERLPMSLRLFGIVDTFSGEPIVTDLGRRILVKVSSKLESLRDTVLLLTESEVSGVHFSENADLINQIKERTRQSPSVGQDQRASIESMVNLFLTGHYLDSLRLFYPNIEAVLNHVLKKKGFRPDDFKGMREKVQRLEQEQVLSSKLGTWAEVIASRNKIVHGNLVEEDAELVKPLFYFIGTFWTLLIAELDNHWSASISSS